MSVDFHDTSVQDSTAQRRCLSAQAAKKRDSLYSTACGSASLASRRRSARGEACEMMRAHLFLTVDRAIADDGVCFSTTRAALSGGVASWGCAEL